MYMIHHSLTTKYKGKTVIRNMSVAVYPDPSAGLLLQGLGDMPER